MDEVVEEEYIIELGTLLRQLKSQLTISYKTAKLWLLYCEYVQVVKLFIRAERTSDWHLHLHSTSKMLNLFAATGHVHYAKSARLYLQIMEDLPHSHPWLYEKLATEKHFTVRRRDRYWAGLWTDLTIEQVLMKSIKSRGGLTRGRGMSEETRLLWIHSMHQCASIHNEMTMVTGKKHSTSDQHVEIGASRATRDFKDLMKITDWLEQNNPFQRELEKLYSLATGLTADESDGINCYDAEIVGFNIQKSLDKSSVVEASIKRREQVKTLQHLKKGITIENQVIHIDPSMLFTRLIVLLERSERMEDYFQFELTPMPTSLFKDGMMRKSNKAALAAHLTGEGRIEKAKRKRKTEKTASSSEEEGLSPKRLHLSAESDRIDDDVENDTIQSNREVFVIDGGAFLHHVCWRAKATYGDVLKQYISYIQSRYSKSIVVFDGYMAGPSTKDHEHQRRNKGNKACGDFVIAENMDAHPSQHLFLSNEKNKTAFISLLTKCLSEEGYKVIQAKEDADTLIVSTAIEYAKSGFHVTVVAEDTDVLVMLLYFWNTDMGNIVVKHERKGKGVEKKIDIGKVARSLDKTVLDNLLFIHAWGGCDTTSAAHGKGKLNIIKFIQQSEDVENACKVFKDEHSVKQEVAEAGCLIFIRMYGGKSCDTLSKLRYVNFMKMASTANKLLPEKLPPSERAAIHHSWRVYLQVSVETTVIVKDIQRLRQNLGI